MTDPAANPDPAATPEPERDERRRVHLLLGLLLALTLAVFAPVCRLAFVDWDDPLHTYQNPYLEPPTLHNLAHFWRGIYKGEYIPVCYMLFAFLSVFGQSRTSAPTPSGGTTFLNPHVFHAANLALHLLNTVLVFLLLRRLVPVARPGAGSRRDAGAFAGALLFAVHPVQVETVAWVSELRGLLSGLFGLAALHLYLSYALTRPGGPGLKSWAAKGRPPEGKGAERAAGAARADRATPRPRRRAVFSSVAQDFNPGPPGTALYLASLSLFVLALLSKPSAIALPALAWVLDRGIARRPLRQSLTAITGWVAALLPVAVLTHNAQPVPPGLHLPLWQRPLVAGDALAFYLSKLLLPLRLGIDYGRTPAHVLHGGPACASGLAAALLLGLLAWRLRRQRPWLPVALALSAAALLPVLGFVPFMFQNFSTVADRYLYLAMLGPALVVATLTATCRPAPAASLAFGAFLAVCAGLSRAQVGVWRDSGTLFTHAVAVNPRSPQMHYNLGNFYSLHNHPAAAIAQYRTALRLRSDYPQALCNLGAALADSGQSADAVAALRDAVRLKPDLAAAHLSLGMQMLDAGNTRAASREWRETLRLDPANLLARYNLACALFHTDPAASRSQFREVLRLQPDYAPALQALRLLTRKKA